jgi:hypothetical protein
MTKLKIQKYYVIMQKIGGSERKTVTIKTINDYDVMTLARIENPGWKGLTFMLPRDYKIYQKQLKYFNKRTRKFIG